jgi:hypothetical protein
MCWDKLSLDTFVSGLTNVAACSSVSGEKAMAIASAKIANRVFRMRIV